MSKDLNAFPILRVEVLLNTNGEYHKDAGAGYPGKPWESPSL